MEDWTVFPDAMPGLWDAVFPELAARAQIYPVQVWNAKEKRKVDYPSHRASCVFRKHKLGEIAQSSLFSYDNLPNFDYTEAGVIGRIGEHLREKLSPLYPTVNFDFDHVLCHIYRDGTDFLNYHNDREAMTTSVISVSIGATRAFRFRPIDWTSGFTHEYMLTDGTVVCMWPGCQQKFKHSVPATTQVVFPRINLTYRV